MPTQTMRIYDIDPDGVLSRSEGSSAVWTGPGEATGVAIITDNGTGGEGGILSDGNRGESATGDISVGSYSASGVSLEAEESWVIRDTITGQEITVVTLNADTGSGYFALTSMPLIEGRTYETVSFDKTPSLAEGTGFAYDDYNDGTVFGTGGDDVIDRAYTGDPNGDVVDGNDLYTSQTEQGTFNWSDYADNQNMTAGATQTSGGVEVTVTSSLPSGSTFIANYDDNNNNTPDTVYVPGGTTFDPNSTGRFFANGNATNTTLTVDFDAVPAAGTSTEVHNVQFVMSDIDGVVNNGNNFQDIITVSAYDAQGNEITVNIEVLGNDTKSGNTVTAVIDSDEPDQADGAILVTIPGPVERVVIDYDNGGNTQQAVFISDINFDTVTQQGNADSIDAGAGNDSVFAGSDNDTVLGGSGNDTLDGDGGDDSLLGGIGNDSLLGGSGADTLLGGDGADVLDGGEDADTITAGDGADTVSGGTGADVIVAGAGNDSVAGDQGNDSITGGTGNDTLAGGTDNDTLSGGAGQDVLDGGTGDDSLAGGEGADSLSGGDGQDTLTGGDGADTLEGGNGDDSLSGDGGNDNLNGGAGIDTLSGGLGDDTIYVGEDDVATGGEGDDLFLIDPSQTGGGTITVTGGEGGETGGDTLDLNGLWVSGGITYTNTDDAAGGFSGSALLTDGTTVTFSEIEKVICFAEGTRIATANGLRRVETLRQGDLLLTRDSGPQPLQWVGSVEGMTTADTATILFRPGALGNDAPLRVSPQHRMLVRGWRAQLLFGEEEILVPAKSLIDGTSVVAEAPGHVRYFHVLTPRHEVVFAEGAEAETFFPAGSGLDGVDAKAVERLLSLRPELRADLSAYGAGARPMPRTRLSQLLVA